MKKNEEKKIRKGGLVKLNADGEAHVASCNRYRTNSAVSGANPLRHAYFGKSKFTAEDAAAYRADIQKQIAEAKAAGEDAWHITMRDDGESRLPPTSTSVKIFPGQVYAVLKARTVGYWNYRKHSGQCLILDPATGREVYVPRHFVEAV